MGTTRDTVAFDLAEGRLRMSLDLLRVLGRCAVGGVEAVRRDPGGVERLAALTASGLLSPTGEVHPEIQAVAETVAAGIVSVHLGFTSRAGTVEADAWVRPSLAVFAVPVAPPNGDVSSADLVEIVTLHPSGVADALARLTDLGPRSLPPVTGTVNTPPAVADALEPGTGTVPQLLEAYLDRYDAGDEWRDLLIGLATGLRARWTASASWMTGPKRAATRRVRVLDAGAGGLWYQLPPEPRNAPAIALTPVSSRFVWWLLCGLLPTDRELRG